jgi:hypothetical protein
MSANSEMKLSIWLFNPFLYLAGAKALLIGWAAILVAGFLGSLNQTHFDGVLDVHTGTTGAPLSFFLCEGFIDWIFLSVALLIAGKIVAHTSFRLIDVAGTQALARWPTVIISLVTFSKGYQRFQAALADQLSKGNVNVEFASVDAVVFLAVVLGMIALICWIVFLMYKAYAVSCNLTGVKAVVSFIVALIAAEICSKTLLFWVVSPIRETA